MDEFIVQLKAVLDKSGIKKDLSEIQKMIEDIGINITPNINISEINKKIKSLLNELTKNINIEFGTNINFNDIEKAYKSAFKQMDSSVSQSTKNVSTDIISQVNEQAKAVVNAEKEKQRAIKATTDTVMYHAGILSKLNKAETNGRFYGSNRDTGYFGTGHYFVDAAHKHELDSDPSYKNRPYSSIDISQYDNLFKANTNELALKLHDFLTRLTRYTQNTELSNINELFSQFEDVFGKNVLNEKQFNDRLQQLVHFMQNSDLQDRSDSVSTQFMKSLGYGGVDTRGTNAADTKYGTVIYDLKEESILQANITDELQKQGDMLEKINYAKGEVWNKDSDARIQPILEQQKQAALINEEMKKIYDPTQLNAYKSELSSVTNKIEENNEIISKCEHAIANADAEARKFARDMKLFGISITEAEIQEHKINFTKSFTERIEELKKENSELEQRKGIIEQNLEAESKLEDKARERAKAIIDAQKKSVENSVSSNVNTDTKPIESVIDAHNRLQEEIKETQNIENEKNTSTTTLSSEEQLADNLRQKFESVETAIRNKTNAITDEKIAMEYTTNSEVESLNKIISRVEELENKIKNIGSPVITYGNQSEQVKTDERLSSTANQTASNINNESNAVDSARDKMDALAASKNAVIEANEKLAQIALISAENIGKEKSSVDETTKSFELQIDSAKTLSSQIPMISKELENSVRNLKTNVDAVFMPDEHLSSEFESQIQSLVSTIEKSEDTLIKLKGSIGLKKVIETDANGNQKWNGLYERNLSQVVATFKTKSGEIRTETYSLKESLEDGSKTWINSTSTFLVDYEKAIKDLENLKQKKDKLSTDLNIAVDKSFQNAKNFNTKNLISDGNFGILEKTYNRIKEQIDDIKNITNESNLRETYNNIRILKSEFDNLLSGAKAENTVSGKLKPETLSTFFITLQNNLESLKIKANSTGIDIIGNLKKYVDEASGILKGTFNENTITSKMLDQANSAIKQARSELKKEEDRIKAENDYKKLDAQKSAFSSQIERLIKENPEFDVWTKEINGTIISVESLKNDLDNLSSTKGISVLRAQLTALKDDFKVANLDDSKSVNNSKLKEADKIYKQMIDSAEKIASFRAKRDTSLGSTNYVDQSIENEKNKLNSLIGEYKTYGNVVPDITQKIKSVWQEAQRSSETYNTSFQTEIAAIKDGLTTRLESTGNKVLQTPNIDTGKVTEQINNIKTAIDSLNDVNGIKNVITQIEQLSTIKDTDNIANKFVIIGERLKQFELEMSKTGLTSSELQQILGNIRNILDSGSEGKTKQDVANLNQELAKARQMYSTLKKTADDARKATKEVNGLSWAWNGLVKTAKSFMRMYISPYRLISSIKNALNVLKEFDTAVTTISYTTDYTQKGLENLGEAVLKLSNDMKTSVSSAMSVAQIYANMNTTAEEIVETAKPTIVLSNLTGMDASTAADAIQGVMQAYDMSVSEAEHIIDVFDTVSKSISVDYTKGINAISEAVKNVGSTAKQAGVSFEQLSSIIGKVQERSRMEGSTISNGLKTIMTRISKASTMSDEVDNETLSKASKVLNEIGIKVYEATGEYRQFDVIMGELADKWDGLTDAQRANISFQLAATRQTNLLQNILATYKDSMALATEATEAHGNALKNQEKYEQSYAGKLQATATAFDTLKIHTLNSDSFKGLIDGITSVIQVLDKLIQTFGTLPLVISGFGIATFIKDFA